MAKKKQDDILVAQKKALLPIWKEVCDDWIEEHNLLTRDFYELANIRKGQYDGLLKGTISQEPLYRMANVVNKDIRKYVPIIDKLEHEGRKGGQRKKKTQEENTEAPTELELEFSTPSYEEYKPEETINENDELVTKGMLKDYIRDLLLSFLEGIV